MTAAFQQVFHLIIRPDDVWITIMVQFSYYVNRNSELLRDLFVAHEEQKGLMVDVSPATVWPIDMGHFAQLMMKLIRKEVGDPELRELLMPNFTTTNDNDKSVAAIAMMGAMNGYLLYRAEEDVISCPSPFAARNRTGSLFCRRGATPKGQLKTKGLCHPSCSGHRAHGSLI